MKKILITAIAAAAFTGCAYNMPTQPAQITGAYVNSMKYESFPCERLTAELDSINRRESQLVIAQEQRIKTSQTQSIWTGYGQGDGVEASELAVVRGEKEAVTKASAIKKCPL